ncbi:2-octaprenylphenol hydroxylase [Rubrobacter xylanophilus DSM 9941]|uniref:2-octaprenylphenol hydroxylase n=1 Tax=Rubrobacter xylanophilus (strain DSM 9941 / JCM 11954 / NBRC 16129 / PRD-1) TaxID=266117 RepID=Q1AWC7_RUBXD|nr:AarF/ABC1/UbiB kinase family protein [Rubrobacter xylanophilus]ABG04301.1 2-octaprenylphenol hydroxylase [Rubrobacter xylanophilus DSM 9941]
MGGRSGNLRRFAQIGRVLVRHGFGFVFDARRERREERGLQEVLAPSFGARLRRALDDLGPTFVKFGQLLSTRSDILPESVLAELRKLQDTVAPMPPGAAQAIVERELGAPVERLFESFDPEPLGSASIGQVHRAVLRDGRVVAVKVQRPEARPRVESDLELMRELAAFIDRRFGERIFVDVPGLVAEFEGVIRRELDYTAEAENARRFRANFAGSRVRIPAVHTDLSTSRVLTLEYVEGTRFYAIRPLLLRPSERRRVAELGAEAIFRMAFEHGFFHGDPHPGNLILTPEGDLALLDFGMVGFLSRGDIDALGRLFVAVIDRDAPAVLVGLEELGVQYAPEVRADLVQDVGEFLHKYSGLSVGEVTLGQALSELISLARRYRLRVPPVFPLLTKALVTAEGIARSIDPTLNVYEVARPYARRLLLGRYRPRAVGEAVEERALEYARYAEDYPEQVRQLLSELADGELEVRLRHRGLDNLAGEVDVLANRLVFAVVTGALIVGSSVLGAFELGGPAVPYIGVPLVSFVGFSLAIALASVVLVIIFRSGRL